MPWCKLCVLSLAVMLANVSAEVVHGGQNVVVVLDDSGSMNEAMGWNASLRRIDAAKQALQTVMEQLPDDARIGILALNRQGADGAWLMPLGPLDRGRLRQAVVQLDADGGTPLGASLKTATDALLELRSRQPYGDFRLLIVTDGEAQDSELVDRYLPQIQQRGITIDVIGVSMAQDHSLATRVDRYRRADDTESLQEALKASLAETARVDGQDTGDVDDFALLQGLSDEVAAAAIEALASIDNRPLEMTAEPDPWNGDAPTPASAPDVSGEPPEPGLPAFAIFAIIIVTVVLSKIVTRATRQRRS